MNVCEFVCIIVCVCMIVCVCVCVCVALFNQHAKRTVLSPVACLSVCLYHIFPHYFINGTIFVKKKSLKAKCFH